jgi:DNA-binding transcriptional MerR regulator
VNRKKDEYLIHELARETGLDPRTIRYYQQEGLLPKPDYQGKFAYYHNDHLMRIKLIQELKKNYLPLKEIRKRLNSLTSEHVQALLESQKNEKLTQSPPGKESDSKPAQASSDTALEFITRLLQPQTGLRIQEPVKTPPQFFRRAETDRYVAGSPSESWRRILLVPGLEIQIKEPLSPQDQKRLEELIKFAKELYL